MPINSDKTQLWKADVARSIDFYNEWFLRFAPGTFRKPRIIRIKEVLAAFEKTDKLETRQYATTAIIGGVRKRLEDAEEVAEGWGGVSRSAAKD